MSDIGEYIRTLREKKQWTQEELADKLHVTRQTISNYEKGRSKPDVEMIKRIASVLLHSIPGYTIFLDYLYRFCSEKHILFCITFTLVGFARSIVKNAK